MRDVVLQPHVTLGYSNCHSAKLTLLMKWCRENFSR